jgi:hypothetical protein
MKLCATWMAVLLCASWAMAQTTRPLGKQSTVDEVLDALHARGQGLKDFVADVSLAETDALSGDTTTLLGKVYHQPSPDGQGRLRVALDAKKIGDKVDKQFRQEYVLDKGWLIDRDYKRKLQVDRQVLKPGQKLNLLKLGEGPFPLPIGQPREEVLKMFDVKKIEAQKDDPADTVHVQLVPRPSTQFEKKFATIDVWVDTASDFPRRIATDNKRAKTITTTDLADIKINSGLEDKHFTLEKVEGWTLKSEALGDF